MTSKSISVTISVDGGARGNPGPAAAGVVIRTSDDGTVIFEAGFFLGRATNNVAEYSGLIEGLRAAARLGAGEANVVSDSELMVRQMTGQYRVRNEGLRPLYEQAQQLARKFAKFSIRHVRREENQHADDMVNQAIDSKRNVGDAAV